MEEWLLSLLLKIFEGIIACCAYYSTCAYTIGFLHDDYSYLFFKIHPECHYHLLNKYLSSAYFVAGIVTDIKKAAMSTSDKMPSLMEGTFSEGRSHLFWDLLFE